MYFDDMVEYRNASHSMPNDSQSQSYSHTNSSSSSADRPPSAPAFVVQHSEHIKFHTNDESSHVASDLDVNLNVNSLHQGTWESNAADNFTSTIDSHTGHNFIVTKQGSISSPPVVPDIVDPQPNAIIQDQNNINDDHIMDNTDSNHNAPEPSASVDYETVDATLPQSGLNLNFNVNINVVNENEPMENMILMVNQDGTPVQPQHPGSQAVLQDDDLENSNNVEPMLSTVQNEVTVNSVAPPLQPAPLVLPKMAMSHVPEIATQPTPMNDINIPGNSMPMPIPMQVPAPVPMNQENQNSLSASGTASSASSPMYSASGSEYPTPMMTPDMEGVVLPPPATTESPKTKRSKANIRPRAKSTTAGKRKYKKSQQKKNTSSTSACASARASARVSTSGSASNSNTGVTPSLSRRKTNTPGVAKRVNRRELARERARKIHEEDRQLAKLARENKITDEALLQKRPKKVRRPAHFDRASPSRFCHVCSRTPKSVKLAVCSRIHQGVCRKVVCEKCFLTYGNFGDPCKEGWLCPHCAGICPGRAQCKTYQKINDKLRIKRLKTEKPIRKPRSSPKNKKKGIATSSKSSGAGKSSGSVTVSGSNSYDFQSVEKEALANAEFIRNAKEAVEREAAKSVARRAIVEDSSMISMDGNQGSDHIYGSHVHNQHGCCDQCHHHGEVDKTRGISQSQERSNVNVFVETGDNHIDLNLSSNSNTEDPGLPIPPQDLDQVVQYTLQQGQSSDAATAFQKNSAMNTVQTMNTFTITSNDHVETSGEENENSSSINKSIEKIALEHRSNLPCFIRELEGIGKNMNVQCLSQPANSINNTSCPGIQTNSLINYEKENDNNGQHRNKQNEIMLPLVQITDDLGMAQAIVDEEGICHTAAPADPTVDNDESANDSTETIAFSNVEMDEENIGTGGIEFVRAEGSDISCQNEGQMEVDSDQSQLFKSNVLDALQGNDTMFHDNKQNDVVNIGLSDVVVIPGSKKDGETNQMTSPMQIDQTGIHCEEKSDQNQFIQIDEGHVNRCANSLSNVVVSMESEEGGIDVPFDTIVQDSDNVGNDQQDIVDDDANSWLNE